MSERKSWDVQRKAAPARGATPPRAPAATSSATQRATATRSVDGMRRAAPKQVATTRASSRSAAAMQDAKPQATPRRAPLPKGTLKERRKQQRKVTQYVVGSIVFLFIAALAYVVWMPALRVQSVAASGTQAEIVERVAQEQLRGTYAFIVPRNSIFLLPTDAIRAAILAQVPEVSAVSISRDSFSSLAIGTTERIQSFVWCGTSIDTPPVDGTCYRADNSGLIFAIDEESTQIGSSTDTSEVRTQQGPVRVFALLQSEATTTPIGTHIEVAERLPDAIRFVDAIRGLGVPVRAMQIRGDEADLYVQGPTRITYVLGKEQQAIELAASAFPTLDFDDGTIEYVDLRFMNKAYVGRFGSTAPEPSTVE